MITVRTLQTQNGTLQYEFEAKRVKNYNMRVRTDGTVYVSAPFRAPLASVDEFVRSHLDFVEKARKRQKQRAEKAPCAPRNGMTVFFGGKGYRLQIVKGKQGLAFSEDIAYLSLQDPEQEAKLLKAMEEEKKKAFYPLLLAACRAREKDLSAVGIPRAREIRLRKMTSMWGNCRSKDGILTFSTMLADVPPSLLDYVICHEYCHLIHADHSARFYALLRRVCPDYAEKRKALRTKSYCNEP